MPFESAAARPFEYRKNIFVINDIDLIVPPTQINIRKEDLTYSWRTLRSKAATKIPTGHGQIMVQVTIPFTNSMILDLHRLIVQFRHSPFCYVDNRYLRESIVPDWPTEQNMAFTMSSLNIAPAQGTSDTWVCEIDLQWFNYFPFLHNFWYREDWNTNWIEYADPNAEAEVRKYSIGWTLGDNYEKENRKSIVAKKSGGVEGHRSWDVVQQSYANNEHKTIFEMEQLHLGEVFDLLPLPDNMEPARFVAQPKDSRIYVRYINYLQRDALDKNFGIRVEEDLEAAAPGLANAFFAVDDPLADAPRTYGLHTNNVPREVRRNWIAEMLRHNYGATFRWNIYKDIRFPNKYTNKLDKQRQSVMSEIHNGTKPSRKRDDLLIVYKAKRIGTEEGIKWIEGPHTDDNISDVKPKRNGFTFPEGKRVPVASLSGTRMGINEFLGKISDRVHVRTVEEGQQIYGSSWRWSYIHKGTDVAVPVGTEVYSIAPGRIQRVVDGKAGIVGTTWRYINILTGEVQEVNPTHTEVYEDWKASAEAIFAYAEGEIDFHENQVRLTESQKNAIGYWVPSVTNAGIFYYVDYTNNAGSRVHIVHDDGTESHYFHLDEIFVSQGQCIDEEHLNDPIATSGRSSKLSPAKVREFLYEASGQQAFDSFGTLSDLIPNQITDEQFVVRPHLHFEVYEPSYLANEQAYNEQADSFAAATNTDDLELIIVDPLPSYEQAPDQTLHYIARLAPGEDVPLERQQEEIQRLKDEGILDDAEAKELSLLIATLNTAGWFYYDRNTRLNNVWEKILSAFVAKRNTDSEFYTPDEVVLTNVMGGLRNVYANIPILGQEYPTQQHLGSIEPYYMLEMHAVDSELDSSTDDRALEGIPLNARVLQKMRSDLQYNARKFRPVIDGWCAAVDTFITRLLGSYYVDDFWTQPQFEDPTPEDVLTNDGSAQILQDWELRKRFMISSSSSATVEGSPGLSVLTFEIEETNPYKEEALISTAPELPQIEDARTQVLKALLNLDFIDRFREKLLPVLAAHAAEGETKNLQSDEFGLFDVPIPNSFNFNPDVNVGPVFGTEDRVYLRDNDGFYEQLLRSIGQDYDTLDTAAGPAVGVWNSLLQSAETVDISLFPTELAQSNAAESDESLEALTTQRIRRFDISAVLESDPELGQIPFEKIRELWMLLNATIGTAEYTLAEHDSYLIRGEMLGSGLDPSEINTELYELGIEGKMWRCWQEYIQIIAERFHSRISIAPGEASEWLQNNSNWLVWDPRRELDTATISQIRSKAYIDSPAELGGQAWTLSNAQFERASRVAKALFGASTLKEQERIWNFHVCIDMAKEYLASILPLREFIFLDMIPRYGYENIFGNLFSDDETQVLAIRSLREPLGGNSYSCGHFRASLSGLIVFTTNEIDPWRRELDTYVPNTSSRSARLGQFGLTGFWVGLLQTERRPSGSPFIWPNNKAHELEKVRYFKQILAKLADDIRADIGLLRAFGLEELALTERVKFTGAPCYPDLDLPFHPYYGDYYSVTPDFYIWNIYEDGQAFGLEVRQEIQGALDQIIDNCYDSMTRLQSDNSYSPSDDEIITEPDLDNKLIVNTKFNAEGTDHGGTDPMATPFYRFPEDETSITQWRARLGGVWDGQGSLESSLTGLSVNQGKEITIESIDTPERRTNKNAQPSRNTTSYLTSDPIKTLENVSVDSTKIRLSNINDYKGSTLGFEYPTRVSVDQYRELATKVDKIEQMFGSRAGFLHQNFDPNTAPSVIERLKGTDAEYPDVYAHLFNKDALKALAKDSSKDLLSRKLSLRRAYPTFKLMFVEEDEFESRLLNFDDFYSYNGVKSFTVELSRKMPADHAVIMLQNIAGTLDGTKRNTVTDLDYFDRRFLTRQEEETDLDQRAENPITQGSAQDQPFGAVVLRPGLNVQLRVGYSNDPDHLHVLISGRVVDVSWNKTGDLAEILIQSFGAELAQVIKGMQRSGNGPTFYTTHELLGSLMLEPEVQHFGRWEFGRLFQPGEASDFRFDFTDYGREGFLGRFKATGRITSWMIQHPLVTMGLIAGVSALSFGVPIPGLSRASTALSKIPFLGKFVSRGLGIAPRLKLARFAAASRKALGASDDAVRISSFYPRPVARALEVEFEAATKALRAAGAADEVVTSFISKYSRLIDNIAEAGRVSGEALEGFAKAAKSLEQEAWMAAFKGQWIKPGLGPVASWGFAELGSFGWHGGKRLTNLFTVNLPAWLAAAYVSATLTDLLVLDGLWRGLKELTIKRIKNFFRAQQASLFLAPQDDNLFPPHPKDYIDIDKSGWDLAAEWVGQGIGRTIFSDESAGAFLGRYFSGGIENALFNKMITPQQCQYQIVSSSIWDMFHEMSLRHPGWVYGARPYGTEFRYTMFFGIPSQRYWARGASARFIDRVTTVYDYLHSTDDPEGGFDITEAEYRALYGDTMEDGRTVDEFKADLIAQLSQKYSFFKQLDSLVEESVGNRTIRPPFEESPEYKAILRLEFTGRALKEYLKALRLRFVPFRRYHLFSSDRDIVWNGIMSSEQACANAVEVIYFPSDYTADQAAPNPIGSQLFKAHAFLAEDKLRVVPGRPYPNCKGYSMARRYGMGELLYQLKDMYRGEIILVGDARIRPWDIGIIVDSYNDMVGPVEVEQVVHNFSHETGFITEIKPSAVVFGNEISSWPVLEAMKLFSLAVRDIEGQYLGTHGHPNRPRPDSGFLGEIAEIINRHGSKEFKTFMNERYQEHIKNKGTFDLIDNIQDRRIDTGIQDAERGAQTALYATGFISLSLAAVMSLGAMGVIAPMAPGGSTLFKSIGGLAGSASGISLADDAVAGLSTLAKGASIAGFGGLAVGSGLALGVGATALWAASRVEFPSVAWLLGGPLLLAHCMRNESVIVVPLIKNGNPIVAGFNYNDPTLIWNNFRGDIQRFVDDVGDGTRQVVDQYTKYGTEMWRNFDINASRKGVHIK